MTAEPKPCRRMTGPEKAEFFREYCDGRIFTSHNVREDMLHLVFLPLALIEPGTLPDVKTIAMVYEHVSQAGARSINGMPTFFSCHLMHVDDWNELRPKIAAELQRRAQVAAEFG